MHSLPFFLLRLYSCGRKWLNRFSFHSQLTGLLLMNNPHRLAFLRQRLSAVMIAYARRGSTLIIWTDSNATSPVS
jgi:deoxyribodipyrimidine photolyase